MRVGERGRRRTPRLARLTMRKFITCSDRIVPVHHPRVLFETAVAMGATQEALLENTQLTRQLLGSAEMRVSYSQYGTLSRNALRVPGDSTLGILAVR